MSSIAISQAPHIEAAPSYATNVGRAFRTLLAALLAVKPEQAASPRARMRDQLAVFRLAKQYEDFSPSLAAELRFIASRG
jgi:hypothetical protein